MWQQVNHLALVFLSSILVLIRQALDKAVAELASAGVANSSSYAVEDSSRLVLTSNTFSFSLAYLQLVDHLMQLFSPGTRHLVNESLVSVLHAHLRHMEAAARASEPKADTRVAARQAAFILDCVLPLTEHRWVPLTRLSLMSSKVWRTNAV